jgi:uncharacterized protein involved in outer membrane biogenesis
MEVFMRKAGIAIGIIVAVIVVAILVFWATFDVNHYRGTIQSQLQSKLGRPVSLGQMHLSLLPPSFQVDNLSIGDDPRFADPKPFVQAAQLNVSVKFWPLLHKDIEIDSLTLKQPQVELIKDKQGVWNFSSLGQNPQTVTNQPALQQPSKPASSQPSPSQPSNGQNSQFALNNLSIRDGQLALTNRQAGTPRSLYKHIDMTLTDFAPDKPFTVDVAAHLPGPGTQEVRLQGKGGPLQQGNLPATPFHGTLNLKGVSVAGLSQFLNSPAVAGTDGTISGSTTIDNKAGVVAADGNMNIENAKVHGVDIGYPITTQYNLSDDLNRDQINVQDTTIKLGQTPLNINGIVNTKPTPMDVNLTLKAGNVSLAEAAKLASAFGVAFAPGTNVTGQASANIRATGPVSKPALNGTLSARNIQASGNQIKQPVTIPAVNFQLTPQQIHSDNFNIVSGGTTLNTNLAVSQYTSKNPILNATVQAPHAELPAILAMAKAYGVTALDKITGQGTMDLNMHLSGPVNSLSSNDIMRALNGNTGLNFNNMKVHGTDLSHQLAAIAGFLKPGLPGQTDQGFTSISHMTGNVTVKNGIAQTNNLQADLDLGKIGVTGAANLASQTLNLHVNAVISQGMSQKVGGTGIGGFMNTALANNQGELVIPVLVTGTFQNPKIAPDVQGVAQMRLKGLLPNSNNPQAGVSGIIGSLLGQKNGQPANGQAQQNQQSPQNAVQQVLEGLFGGKKKPQTPPPNPPKK